VCVCVCVCVCVFVAVKSVTTSRHVGELSELVISLIRQPSQKSNCRSQSWPRSRSSPLQKPEVTELLEFTVNYHCHLMNAERSVY
jgi:hypothetical protein